jgi:uncharacterized protein affecting Mg2+/Co2+ transport
VVALAVNYRERLGSLRVAAVSLVVASQSLGTNVVVWGYTVAVTKAVQSPLNLVNTWTKRKNCRNDSLVLGEVFGVVGLKVEEVEQNQSYC